MANENVPAPAPTRSDDQILPFAAAFTASTSLDKNWFTLDDNLLREALEITPIDQAHLFVSPPSGDVFIDFVNELGYPEVIHFVSSMAVNHLTNVDYAELMWEEFVQAMQTFLTDKANLGSPTKKGKKDKPHLIPYCQFKKLITCHLVRMHNIHQRSASRFHLAEEDLRLGNLKFVSKGEIDEVFGMPIPNELISNNIRNESYYNAYLEMVAKHDQKVAAKKEGKKKSASTKQPKPKLAIEKSSKPAPAPKPNLVDEPDEEPAHSKPEPEPEQEGAGEEYDMERTIQISLESFQAHGHAHVGGVAIQEPVVEAIRPLPVVEGKDAETGATSDKTSSGGDTEIVQITEELGEDVEKQENVKEKMVELDQDQAGSDPGETLESRPQPEQVHMEEDQAGPDPGISRVALAGPDPEPTHDEFMADLYPKVQESLKFSADEHVILEDPLSSTGTLSSMKNLEDAYAIGDQFINDKSTDDEPGKLNVEAEVVSMVTVPIYQASSSVPPLSTPVIDLSPPKPASSTTQTPIFTATTTTTTTPLPPPPQQQSTTESELAERVAALEKKLSDLEQTNKNLDNTTRNLGSRVYTLELRDLPHKINEAVRENVKEAVQIALQAPLRDRFRDLSEEDMKEMLHQRMFKSGTYKLLPEHIALYEALEESIARAQRDQFLTKKDKSCKRHRDDQDPPPPPPDLDLTKRRRHDTGASGSSQPPAPQSSTCKKSDTRDAPSSSSKQQSGPHDEQPVEDIPIPDSANISDSKDTGSAHLPYVKPRPAWLKPILEDDRPATPEAAWVIPTSHVPDAENNWANALATTYQALAENSLLEKTGDMLTFMMWYCQRWERPSLLKQILKVKFMKSLKLSTQTLFIFSFRWKSVTRCLQIRLTGLIQKVINKGSGQALSISKMKAARYHEFRLELLVSEHMWIDDVCTYDISASYGISHWWFNHQKFYIDQHTAKSSHKIVRTHMRILSVVRIKAYSRYGYDYLKEITLRRANHQEYMIAEKDFKNLYPSDFEDLNLLLFQGHLNHLPGSDIRMLSTAVKLWTQNLLNLTKHGWDATDFEFKHDYTIIDSPRAVVFPVSNNERKIMRFNEVYKFSDGRLTNIIEALDYRVKEYRVNRLNPGMDTQFWTDKDVEMSKEFIHAIEWRLKTRRIFRNLECFVGGRVCDIDYRLL
ncbi:hypothetical protein Tco_1475969 [Tanacetum coccineum]